GDHDGARPGEAHLPWDFALVADREVPVVELLAFPRAVLDELLDRGLDQGNAAVVAVELDVCDQVVDRAEAALIGMAAEQLDLVPLIQDDTRAEIAHADGNGFDVGAVGGVADEAGAGIGGTLEDPHAEVLTRTALGITRVRAGRGQSLSGPDRSA